MTLIPLADDAAAQDEVSWGERNGDGRSAASAAARRRCGCGCSSGRRLKGLVCLALDSPVHCEVARLQLDAERLRRNRRSRRRRLVAARRFLAPCPARRRRGASRSRGRAVRRRLARWHRFRWRRPHQLRASGMHAFHFAQRLSGRLVEAGGGGGRSAIRVHIPRDGSQW